MKLRMQRQDSSVAVAKREEEPPLFRVYNLTRNTYVTLRAVTLSESRIPAERLLKQMCEETDRGVWLNPFEGLDFPRELPPFDLLYLDESHRVLREVRSSDPRRGELVGAQISSVLVLPGGAIQLSETQTFDQFVIGTSAEMKRYLGLFFRPPSVTLNAELLRTFAARLHAQPVRSLAAPPAASSYAETSEATRKPSSTSKLRFRLGSKPQSDVERLLTYKKRMFAEFAQHARGEELPPTPPPALHGGDDDFPEPTSGTAKAAPQLAPAPQPAPAPRETPPPAQKFELKAQLNALHEGALDRFSRLAPNAYSQLLRSLHEPTEKSTAAHSGPSPATSPAAPLAAPPTAPVTAATPVPAIARSAAPPVAEAARPAERPVPRPVKQPAPAPASSAAHVVPMAAPQVAEGTARPPAPVSPPEKKQQTAPAETSAARSLAHTPVRHGELPTRAVAATEVPVPLAAQPAEAANSKPAQIAARKAAAPAPAATTALNRPEAPVAPPAAKPARKARLNGLLPKLQKSRNWLDAKYAEVVGALNELTAEGGPGTAAEAHHTGRQRGVLHPQDRRGACRRRKPGLDAFYWTGASPQSHEIGDISHTGFFILTSERWLPGTLLRLTLQKKGTTGERTGDSITLWARVVRLDLEGVGTEIVFSDSPAYALYGPLPGGVLDRAAVHRFL